MAIKMGKLKLNPAAVLIWVFVAIASAVITWLVLMTDDAELYRAEPSSTIPHPDQIRKEPTQHPIQSSLYRQNKLSIELNPDMPKLGIIVTNLGLQNDLTQHALANLPAYITMSFSPYTYNKNELFQQAFEHQHEVMIDIPMTLTGDEVCDGGPCAIEASLTADENYRKIKRILNGAQGCVGLNCFYKDESAEKLVKDLIPRFKSDPFFLVAHMKDTQDMPASLITPVAFQEDASEEVLIEQLARAEESLSKDKPHMLIGRATPTLVEALQKWGQTLPHKNIQLIPLSAYTRNG